MPSSGVAGATDQSHAELAEAWEVARRDVLRVLDPEAPIARAILPRHSLEDAQLHIDGAIPDRVNDDVKPCPVGSRRPGIEVLGRVHEQAAIRR